MISVQVKIEQIWTNWACARVTDSALRLNESKFLNSCQLSWERKLLSYRELTRIQSCMRVYDSQKRVHGSQWKCRRFTETERETDAKLAQEHEPSWSVLIKIEQIRTNWDYVRVSESAWELRESLKSRQLLFTFGQGSNLWGTDSITFSSVEVLLDKALFGPCNWLYFARPFVFLYTFNSWMQQTSSSTWNKLHSLAHSIGGSIPTCINLMLNH